MSRFAIKNPYFIIVCCLSQAQLQQTQAEIGNSQAGYDYRAALAALRFETGSF